MAISTRTFSDLVRAQAAAVQGAAAGLVDVSVGSILRAVLEATALVGLWLQGLFLQLMAASRAATAQSSDLDSWMADFGLTRLGAIAAQGDVTFSRRTGVTQVTIAPGATVTTADASQTYAVIADTLNSKWSVALNAYVMNVGDLSISVPVVASKAGAAGNAALGAVSLISSTIVGVDTVTNAASFFSGADPETDAQFRIRFQLFIASLSKATKAAIAFAIQGLEQNLRYSLVEDEDYTGAPKPGHFYVVIDDGTGSPTAAMINAVASAIEQVRPIGIDYGVYGPVPVAVTISCVVTLFNGAVASDVVTDVSDAIEAYVDGLGLGGVVRWTKIAQVAYEASAGVVNVASIHVNGIAQDISCNPKQLPRLNTVTVSIA